MHLGFAPWPKVYSPQPDKAEITSVHINFVGVRARVGFRFAAKHKESGFGISQDEIDLLRSRKYPRQKQDRQFLEEARGLLLNSFKGKPEDLKIMAVDLGTGGGGAVIFKDKELIKTEQLEVIKIDRLYNKSSKKEEEKKENKRFPPEKGLGVEHAGKHLETWADEASKISLKRNEIFPKPDMDKKYGLVSHDLRGLTLHMRGMYRDWVRLNASQIIKIAEENHVDLIVFESQRGFSLPGRDKLDKDEKRRKAFWSQGRIRHKVKEKAVERGMRVIGVPYFKSSRVCAKCRALQENHGLWRKNKGKGIFQCEKCKEKSDSDENAARVLGKVFWGDIRLPDPTP